MAHEDRPSSLSDSSHSTLPWTWSGSCSLSLFQKITNPIWERSAVADLATFTIALRHHTISFGIQTSYVLAGDQAYEHADHNI